MAQRLTKRQAQNLKNGVCFWAAHAGHWAIAIVFIAFTLSILYLLHGNDAAFAAVMMGIE